MWFKGAVYHQPRGSQSRSGLLVLRSRVGSLALAVAVAVPGKLSSRCSGVEAAAGLWAGQCGPHAAASSPFRGWWSSGLQRGALGISGSQVSAACWDQDKKTDLPSVELVRSGLQSHAGKHRGAHLWMCQQPPLPPLVLPLVREATSWIKMIWLPVVMEIG